MRIPKIPLCAFLLAAMVVMTGALCTNLNPGIQLPDDAIILSADDVTKDNFRNAQQIGQPFEIPCNSSEDCDAILVELGLSDCFNATCDDATSLCVWENACDDGDLCTLNRCDFDTDNCVSTSIVHPDTGLEGCDDLNPCTIDTCSQDPAGCQNQNLACTFADPDGVCCGSDTACAEGVCTAGECVLTPIDCDDGDPCTLDSCDDAGGCIHEPAICDDLDACTMDSCDMDGNCAHEPVDCDDDDSCTVDTCMDNAGTAECVYDEIVCDPGLKCVGGECVDNCTDCDPDACCEPCDPCDPCPDPACGDGCTPDQCEAAIGWVQGNCVPIHCSALIDLVQDNCGVFCNGQ